MLFPLLGAVVGVAAGAVVGVAVGAAAGAVVGVGVGVLAVEAVLPHAAIINKRLTVNKQSQTLVVALAKYFCIVLFSPRWLHRWWGLVLVPMRNYVAQLQARSSQTTM